MATSHQSGTLDTAGGRDSRLHKLLAEMQRDAADLQASLSAELAQAASTDPSDVRFPPAARLLAARLDNLNATIAQIADRL